MTAVVPRSSRLATVLAFHRSEVECLHCIADRLVAGWSLAAVVRLPSGGYLARFNRPRKSARSNSTGAVHVIQASGTDERTNTHG